MGGCAVGMGERVDCAVTLEGGWNEQMEGAAWTRWWQDLRPVRLCQRMSGMCGWAGEWVVCKTFCPWTLHNPKKAINNDWLRRRDEDSIPWCPESNKSNSNVHYPLKLRRIGLKIGHQTIIYLYCESIRLPNGCYHMSISKEHRTDKITGKGGSSSPIHV